MTIHYKLETFEGPLDLLLHLVDQAEIDIHEISISEITDQYLAYLNAMQELELEITSEFLVMAATLLAIKSRQLLPKPPVVEEEWPEGFEDDEIDTREELIRRLVEYRKYKEIAGKLRELETDRGLVYTKEPEDLTPYMPSKPENPVQGLVPADLAAAYMRALRRQARRNIVSTVRRDEISVKDRIRDIAELLREHSTVKFSKLIRREMDRQEIVVTFLAILELMKRRAVYCFQHRLFDDIVIQWRGDAAASGLQDLEIDY
ncbi:MAG: segregation/condensation protein A [Thermobacillus sp.]|uniref:segregation and condensation protein A n=1 Tax=Thermobacillus sp. TaxID=2108467 RepID=UPI000E3A1DA8|nr:segregation/condensation protein A [Thermobacillus sp.]REK59155.1 MAG: segregation/condensation protein A [Thermobacillus sp.]